jgi:hypothetical protein
LSQRIIFPALREGHNANFMGIEAMHALKRVAAWETFSVSDLGNCNRPRKRIEIENSLRG